MQFLNTNTVRVLLTEYLSHPGNLLTVTKVPFACLGVQVRLLLTLAGRFPSGTLSYRSDGKPM